MIYSGLVSERLEKRRSKGGGGRQHEKEKERKVDSFLRGHGNGARYDIFKKKTPGKAHWTEETHGACIHGLALPGASASPRFLQRGPSMVRINGSPPLRSWAGLLALGRQVLPLCKVKDQSKPKASRSLSLSLPSKPKAKKAREKERAGVSVDWPRQRSTKREGRTGGDANQTGLMAGVCS